MASSPSHYVVSDVLSERYPYRDLPFQQQINPLESTLAHGSRAIPKLKFILDSNDSTLQQKENALIHLLDTNPALEATRFHLLENEIFPTIAQLLHKYDSLSIILPCCQLLKHLVQFPSGKEIVLINPMAGPLLPLLKIFSNHPNPCVQLAVCQVFQVLAPYSDSGTALSRAGLIPQLVKCLGTSDIPSDLRNCAIDTLGQLFLLDEAIIASMREPVVENILPMLSQKNHILPALNCLLHFCLYNPAKASIVKCGIVNILSKLVLEIDRELLEAVLRLITLVAVNTEAKIQFGHNKCVLERIASFIKPKVAGETEDVLSEVAFGAARQLAEYPSTLELFETLISGDLSFTVSPTS